MSKYTTGEIAKLCGVSVRTVQYYDSRNILVPSELSEGGRRLYSEEDLTSQRLMNVKRQKQKYITMTVMEKLSKSRTLQFI